MKKIGLGIGIVVVIFALFFGDVVKELVAMFTNGVSQFSGILPQVIVVGIGCLILSGILYLLGLSGKKIREGVEIKKALKKVEIEAKNTRATLTPKYYEYRGKANRKIMIPVLIWLIIYAILFFYLPLNLFLLSLLALIIPFLGFLGIFISFTPSDDPNDYK